MKENPIAHDNLQFNRLQYSSYLSRCYPQKITVMVFPYKHGKFYNSRNVDTKSNLKFEKLEENTFHLIAFLKIYITQEKINKDVQC